MSSWGWSWALIPPWAYPLPHKCLPAEGADSTEALLLPVPSCYPGTMATLHLPEPWHALCPILSPATALALAGSTPRGSSCSEQASLSGYKLCCWQAFGATWTAGPRPLYCLQHALQKLFHEFPGSCHRLRNWCLSPYYMSIFCRTGPGFKFAATASYP